MVFISLGYNCKVRQSIDRFNGFRKETHFFDWVVSNFKFVLHTFQHFQEPEIFLEKDHFKNIGIFFFEPNHYYIAYKNKNLIFHSLHDLSINNSYDHEINIFIEKYKRRLKRLYELILNTKEKIHFIHMIDAENVTPITVLTTEENIPTIDEINNFINKIKELNINCNFCLHLLIVPENYKYTEKINQLKNENVEIHYMKSDPNIDPFYSERRDLNWEEIYSTFN
jgi:hypothetical protein